jgi:hypothetical protein
MQVNSKAVMSRKKVCLIPDNLKVHHAKVVKAGLADHADEIEVFLPAFLQPRIEPR